MNELDTNVKYKVPDKVLDLAYQIIEQTQYEHLDAHPLTPLAPEIDAIDPSDILCLFKVRELVFNKEKGSLDAFRVVLNALHACGATCVMLLTCREGQTELYLGAANKSRPDNLYYLNTIREILSTGLKGNLPGTELEEVVRKQDIRTRLEECLADGFDAQCITSVSCVASPLKKDSVVVGLEKLVDAVGEKNFSLLVLADPVDSGHIQQIRSGYQAMATELSEFESVNESLQSSRNVTLSASSSTSISRSISESISYTQSHNLSNGWSDSVNKLEADESSQARELLVQGSRIAMAALNDAKVKKPVERAIGMAVLDMAASMLGPGASPTNHSVNQSESKGESNTKGQQKQQGTSEQQGKSASSGETFGISVSTNRKDKHIQNLLDKIDRYLDWLKHCENYGMFNCCTYIVSSSASTNLLVASQYQALMQGEDDISHAAAINTWTKGNGIRQAQHYLTHLMHPTIEQDDAKFSPAMLISSRELARQMSLPQASIVGVSVMEYTPFGREVVRKAIMGREKVIRVGVVSHMGATMPNQPVLLNANSLAAHTFIAGTNGSGKSNAIFRILEELLRDGIPFMVIEPAKGEYKNVFGPADGISVYGTNRRKMPLLRLNPFWFNEDIDVKEHIARVMDVFKASWPMYAAMPSILNTAIENAYRTCGWNLETSRCLNHRIFPTIADVQQELGRKMESTAFSDEVRGNYVGALSTRMESLTTGQFADVFSGADLGDKALFESNVIVDLSRAGSQELSAMVMGMLLIRLREYRMSEGALNHPLRHVTVLEEAHHLLRKTSGVQSEDSSNLMGKAVEMISTAIAEMRSYGDGFIIADQSPGLLDTSVLRNTNTKIILRLPESGDREMVAGTMGMTPKQAGELSRLKTGVAAIYQKDWLEPVLCQVDMARHAENLYSFDPDAQEDPVARNQLVLLEHILGEGAIGDTAEAAALALNCVASGTVKRELLGILGQTSATWKQRAEIAAALWPLTMDLPPLGDGALDQWMDDIIEVNQLPHTELSRLLIAANAKTREDDSPRWSALARRLYSDQSDVDGLRRARGLGWTIALFGKEAVEGGVSDGALASALGLLAAGSDADTSLAGLVEAYRAQGRTRREGELDPYTVLAAWYTGGDEAWSSAYPSIQRREYAAWDSAMRAALRERVACDTHTEDEILGLLLQFYGGYREVRAFYYPWFSWRKNAMGAQDM